MLKHAKNMMLIILLLILNTHADKPCRKRSLKQGRVVCVCNAEYCDEISKIKVMRSGKYVKYTSDKNGKRFEKTSGLMRQENEPNSKFLTVLHINRNITFQKIIGFGGTFTDSFGIVAQSLSERTRMNLFRSYFSENGLEYNMGRVPMGSSDFSDRFYVYNMSPENDVNLSNFTLDEYDFKYKISMIKNATQMSTDEIYLMASAWSAPKWMTEKGSIRGLKKDYYKTWSNYHLKFLQEYKKNAIKLWAINTGNEPSYSVILPFDWDGLGWLPIEQATWLVENLGPTIKNSEFHDVKILGFDDQRLFMDIWMRFMETVDGAVDYMDGIAIHWYSDKYSPIKMVDNYHKIYPNNIIVMNEASIATTARDPWDLKPIELGYWRRGELYIIDIMEYLNHWCMGWMEWNLALNDKGGPTWRNMYIDASIIVMTDEDEFVKQPTYYAVGHFSKFIPRNSVRISIEVNNDIILHVAFLREDGGISIILYNPSFRSERIIIKEMGKGYIDLILTPKSMNSLIYW